MPYIGNPIYQSAFVTDQFSGTGSQTVYTMSVAPAGTTNVLVVVSGVVQDPSTYGVVGNTLTFSTAPPSGTGNISCRYLGVPVTGVTTTAYRTVTEFTATASQTTFTPPSYNVGFINVYLNGVLLGSADYTATNGTTVVLATGASAGNILTVESFQISSVANAIPNTAGAIDLAGSLVSGTLPVANGGTGVTTSTGTGAGVHATSPTLTTPIVATTIGVGGATPSASGSGITFPATQSASTDANTLDDYEEGTWTPTISNTAGGGTGSPTYAYQSGYYTKIGKLVVVSCNIGWNKNTMSGGNIRLNGLPFTMPSPNDISTPLGQWYFPSGTAVLNAFWYGNSGTTYGDVYTLVTANIDSTGSPLTVSATGPTSQYIKLIVSYQVA